MLANKVSWLVVTASVFVDMRKLSRNYYNTSSELYGRQGIRTIDNLIRRQKYKR
jgi:hypothetical protein